MARNHRKILFVPNWRVGNPYQSMLAAALGGQGCQVAFADYPKARLPLLRLCLENRDCGVLHLHWITELVAAHLWSPGRLTRYLKLFILILDLRLCRLLGVRVFWTIHNLLGHESGDEAWERRIRRLLGVHVTGCFVHSESALRLLETEYRTALAGKTTIVPHASYIGQYADAEPSVVADLRAEFGLEDRAFVYLFIGALRRYKGVEVLVKAFRELPDADARLVNAGPTFPTEASDWLEADVAADDRIVLRKGFVPDELMTAYLALADVVVLPFARTLTSGSTLLAMSFGKPLILPDSARVFDVPGDAGALYFGEGELPAVLKAARQADLLAMSRYNLAEAETRTWDRMGELTATEYADPGSTLGLLAGRISRN